MFSFLTNKKKKTERRSTSPNPKKGGKTKRKSTSPKTQEGKGKGKGKGPVRTRRSEPSFANTKFKEPGDVGYVGGQPLEDLIENKMIKHLRLTNGETVNENEAPLQPNLIQPNLKFLVNYADCFIRAFITNSRSGDKGFCHLITIFIYFNIKNERELKSRFVLEDEPVRVINKIYDPKAPDENFNINRVSTNVKFNMDFRCVSNHKKINHAPQDGKVSLHRQDTQIDDNSNRFTLTTGVSRDEREMLYYIYMNLFNIDKKTKTTGKGLISQPDLLNTLPINHNPDDPFESLSIPSNFMNINKKLINSVTWDRPKYKKPTVYFKASSGFIGKLKKKFGL